MSLKDTRTRLLLGGALVAAVVVILILVLGGEDDSDSLEAALKYVPPDAPQVVSLETDLSDDQWEAFGRTAGRGLLAQLSGGFESDQPAPPVGLPDVAGLGGVESTVSTALLAEGINYEGEVKPALGGQLVAGVTEAPESVDELTGEFLAGDGLVYALQLDSTGAAENLMREQLDLEPIGDHRGAELWGTASSGPLDETTDDDAELAIDDGVLIGADDADVLLAAIDRERDGKHLTLEDFDAATEGTPEDALVRAAVNPAPYLELPDLVPLKEVPWPAAFTSIGATVSFEGRDAEVELVAHTDSADLSAEDLPFPPETGEPALVRQEGEVASGSINQSYTTAFLLRAARAMFADSDFVRDTEAIESDLGIDFEQEVLRQFDGPSASSVSLDGNFAARSTVADPEAMRKLLPQLAPRLPQLVRDLDSLGQEGLLALLFIAPDAPVSTTPSGAKSVAPAVGAEDEQLYVIRAPAGPRGLEPIVALPERIVFGMIGDTFVVASTLERAHQVAAAEPEPIEGLSGASVLAADELGEVPAGLEGLLGIDFSGVSEVRASVEADVDRTEASLTATFGD